MYKILEISRLRNFPRRDLLSSGTNVRSPFANPSFSPSSSPLLLPYHSPTNSKFHHPPFSPPFSHSRKFVSSILLFVPKILSSSKFRSSRIPFLPVPSHRFISCTNFSNIFFLHSSRTFLYPLIVTRLND